MLPSRALQASTRRLHSSALCRSQTSATSSAPQRPVPAPGHVMQASTTQFNSRLPTPRVAQGAAMPEKISRSGASMHGGRSSRSFYISAAVASGSTAAAPTSSRRFTNADIKLLYDGDCPLCMKEVNFLRGRDEKVNRPQKIEFVDITSPSYRPEDNAGIEYPEAMRIIHAILPDGTIITEVEVFRRLYEAVGLGWVYAITKNPAVLKVANLLYGLWARFRMQLTGREEMSVLLARRSAEEAGMTGSACRDESGEMECVIPDDDEPDAGRKV